MKKLLILVLLLVSCRKVEVIPTPIQNKDIFSVSQSNVSNGNEIQFNLPLSGIYTLTLSDSIANQVVSRERFTGVAGINKMKIYTSSISSKYLYLILEDQNKNKVGKTTIIIN